MFALSCPHAKDVKMFKYTMSEKATQVTLDSLRLEKDKAVHQHPCRSQKDRDQIFPRSYV